MLAAEEQRRAAAEVNLYSAVDNPFNDANLTDRFVWGKKREKEKKSGLTAEEAARRDAQRRAEAEEELERLNRRRADREAEMQLREEEAMRMARQQESAQMAAWHAKESDFHLEQAMRRAAIRTREGRAKPIDLLALNLKWSQPRTGEEDEDEEDEGIGLDVDLEEPYLIFDNLTLEETEELYEDIEMYISLEKSEANLEFWRAMIVVCAAALETLRSERTMGRAAFLEQNRANEAVKNDITNLLRGKSLDELRQLQDSVRAKLSSGDPIDVEYWEGLLKELAVWMAKAKLKAMHEVVLRNRLEHLRRRQRDEAAQVQSELADTVEEEAAATSAAAASEVPAEGEEPAVVREQWSSSMAPKAVSKVPMEDQNLQLLDADEQLQKIVSNVAGSSALQSHRAYTVFLHRLPLDAPSRKHDSYPREELHPQKAKNQPTLQKRLSRQKQRKVSKKTRKSGRNRRSKSVRPIAGKTSIVRESQDTSTRLLPVSSGTSIIRHITSKYKYIVAWACFSPVLTPRVCTVALIIHHQRLCKRIASPSSARIWLTTPKLQHTRLSKSPVIKIRASCSSRSDHRMKIWLSASSIKNGNTRTRKASRALLTEVYCSSISISSASFLDSPVLWLSETLILLYSQACFLPQVTRHCSGFQLHGILVYALIYHTLCSY